MEKNLSILIVDDDSYERKIFIDAVGDINEQFTCAEANNGELAL